MGIIDDLRTSYPRPPHLSEGQWEERLVEMSSGRQLTGTNPKEVALAKHPAIGRHIHSVKSMEASAMSDDLKIVPLEKQLGMKQETADAAATRFRAIAETALDIAKSVENRAGKGDGEALGSDLADASARLGFAALEAGAGRFAPVESSKAEGIPEAAAKEVIKRIGASVEQLLSLRRIVQERSGGEGAETASPALGQDVLDGLKEVRDLVGGISETYGKPKGKAGEDDKDKDAGGDDKDDKDKNLVKAEGLIAQLSKERIEVVKAQLDKLTAGVGTGAMTKREIRDTISSISGNLWKLEDDMTIVAKHLGLKSGDAPTDRIAAVEKSVGDLEGKVERLEGEQVDISKGLTDVGDSLAASLGFDLKELAQELTPAGADNVAAPAR